MFFQVQASSTISLLQTDIRAALKSAFSSVDGPLSVSDWCRGRSPSNESGLAYDGFSAESTASASECRDSSSTATLVGEPMSPSLSSGPVSSLKCTIFQFSCNLIISNHILHAGHSCSFYFS